MSATTSSSRSPQRRCKTKSTKSSSNRLLTGGVTMTQPRVAAKAQEVVEDSEQTEKAPDSKLYEELGELARFIDTTMKTLSEFSTPVSTSTEQLPQAPTHLTNLKTMTEQGTHRGHASRLKRFRIIISKIRGDVKGSDPPCRRRRRRPRYSSRFRISECDRRRRQTAARYHDGALLPGPRRAKCQQTRDHSTGSRT